jgi:hypothetical protein
MTSVIIKDLKNVTTEAMGPKNTDKMKSDDALFIFSDYSQDKCKFLQIFINCEQL